MKTKSALFLGLCLSAAAAYAETPSRESLEKLFEVQQFDKIFDESTQAIPSATLQSLQAQEWFRREIPESKRPAVLAKARIYTENMTAGINTPKFREQLRQLAISGGAAVYTQEEVDAMIQFYSSPIGRSINDKTPKYLSAVMADMGMMIDAKVKEHEQKNLPKFIREVNLLVCGKPRCTIKGK